jgi:hypothetical protein
MPRHCRHQDVRVCRLARHRCRMPRKPHNQRCTLQTVPGEALPFLKDIFLTMTLGRCPLKNLVFVANITNVIIRLYILRCYDASVDLGRQMLSCRKTGITKKARTSSLVGVNEKIIPAWWEGCDGSTGEPTRSWKWPGGTKSRGPRSRRTTLPGPWSEGTRRSREDRDVTKGSAWHTVRQTRSWSYQKWNHHWSGILPRSYKTWLQRPGQNLSDGESKESEELTE